MQWLLHCTPREMVDVASVGLLVRGASLGLAALWEFSALPLHSRLCCLEPGAPVHGNSIDGAFAIKLAHGTEGSVLVPALLSWSHLPESSRLWAQWLLTPTWLKTTKGLIFKRGAGSWSWL